MTHSLDQATLQLRRQIDHFVKLTDAEWAGIVPHLRLVTLKKHECFARQGVVAGQVALVLEGMLRQFYTKEGEERTTYFFFEDRLMSAYMSCVTGRPSPVTIEAMNDTVCVQFSYAVLQALFVQYPGWQLFGRLIAEQIMVGLEDRMAGLLLRSPEERYLALLQGNQKTLIQRVPQHYLANYLGITPVSMSRIRNRIQRK